MRVIHVKCVVDDEVLKELHICRHGVLVGQGETNLCALWRPCDPSNVIYAYVVGSLHDVVDDKPTASISNEFLDHHGLRINETLSLRCILHCIPLSDVYIGLRDFDDSMDDYSKYLHMIDVALKNTKCGGLLARRGDELCLCTFDDNNISDYTGEVVDCRPVLQGVITAQTRIVLVALASPPKALEDKAPPLTTTTTTMTAEYLNFMPLTVLPSAGFSELSLNSCSLNTTTVATHRNDDMYNVSSSLSAECSVTALRSSLVLRVKVLPAPHRLSSTALGTVGGDVTVRVGVSILTLAALHLFTESWVNIDVVDNSNGKCLVTGIRHIALLYAIFNDDNEVLSPQLPENLVAYLPPALLFALQGGNMFNFKRNDLHVIITPVATPPIARRVEIARISTLGSNGHENYSMDLRRYFQSPRVVSIGDILTVKTQFKEDDSGDTDNFFNDDVYCNSDINQPPLWTVASSPVGSFFFFCVTSILDASGSVASYGKVVIHDTCLEQEGVICCHRAPYTIGFLSGYFLPEGCVSFSSADASTRLISTAGEAPIGLKVPFKILIDVTTPCLISHRRDNSLSIEVTSVLLCGPHGCGKTTIARAFAESYGMQWLRIDMETVSSPSTFESALKKARNLVPCVLYLSGLGSSSESANENTLQGEFNVDDDKEKQLRTLLMSWRSKLQCGAELILLGGVTDENLLSSSLRTCFHHAITVPPPNRDTCVAFLNAHASNSLALSTDVDAVAFFDQCTGFSRSDILRVLSLASIVAMKRVLKVESHAISAVSDKEEMLMDVAAAVPILTMADLTEAARETRGGETLVRGMASVPSLHWDAVGGLEIAKAELRNTIELPIRRPELFAAGMHRTGVLLWGPPGTGKTLLAKAVATECALTFISVKGPELIDMYVGESERNIRDVFARAKSCAPCVVFFDELDSLAPKRGNAGDSGGVMDRLVAQFLSELDYLQRPEDDGAHDAFVFVIGATNRPDLIDPGLLRPGRFDQLIYLGVCDSDEMRLDIIRAQTRDYTLDCDVDLAAVVAAVPSTFTGADFSALCKGAFLAAIRRRVNSNDCDSSSVIIAQQDFLWALSDVIPSVTEKDMAHYEALRLQYS